MPEPPLYNPFGLPFAELESVDSTNNYALAKVHAGLASHGAAFFAHEQLAGKGQRGKTWVAAKDSSLLLSVVVAPAPVLVQGQQFQLSACIAVSACELFARYAGDDTRIKWPNDIYWQDRKAGGILIENIIGKPELAAEGPGWRWSIAGIGLNINQESFPAELKNPVSLLQISGRKSDTGKLARELCLLLEKNWKIIENKGFEEIYQAYLQRLYKLNQTVRLRSGARVFEAGIKHVSRSGTLLVQHAIEEEFVSGTLEWLIPGS